MKNLTRVVFALVLCLPAAGPALAQQTEPPIVRAVMFFSPACGYCHIVMDEVLPPLAAQYGGQLQILLIDASQPAGGQLYGAAVQALGIPPERTGVPTLVIGDVVLVGSIEIPELLPGLIEQHLANGLPWPAIPGLANVLPLPAPTAQAGEPAVNMTLPIDRGTAARPTSDGFSLAIVTLAGMVVALVYAGGAAALALRGIRAPMLPPWLGAAIPVIALLGLGVAGYLAYVETLAVPAVCGPIGDCNVVQNSPYAKLFGWLPIGVLGVLGYVAILAAWLWGRLRGERRAGYAPLAVFAMSVGGLLFSLYLTYLEPFVIGAVCAWCLASAVLITLLALLSLRPALQSLAHMRRA